MSACLLAYLCGITTGAGLMLVACGLWLVVRWMVQR